MSIHDGHRGRLRARFLSGGVGIMNEHELLELILTYSIPRRDVNPLAHDLIAKYGSLECVLSAEPDELVTNRGISYNSAALLNLIGSARSGAFIAADARPHEALYSVRDAMEYFMRVFGKCAQEGFCAVFLNARGRVLGRFFKQGEAYTAGVDVKELVRRAVACGAIRVVTGHCHAVGKAESSEYDTALNRRIASVLNELDITLAEHIIVTRNDCLAVLHNVGLADLRNEENAGADELRLIG